MGSDLDQLRLHDAAVKAHFDALRHGAFESRELMLEALAVHQSRAVAKLLAELVRLHGNMTPDQFLREHNLKFPAG